MYFNYDNAVIDKILGRTNWSNEDFYIKNLRTNRFGKVVLWRSPNGGSKGKSYLFLILLFIYLYIFNFLQVMVTEDGMMVPLLLSIGKQEISSDFQVFFKLYFYKKNIMVNI